MDHINWYGIKYYRIPEWQKHSRAAGSLFAIITKDDAATLPEYNKALNKAIKRGIAVPIRAGEDTPTDLR